MDCKELKVGDVVVVYPYGNYARWNQSKQTTTVKSVGKKYITIDIENAKFSIGITDQKSLVDNYSSGYYVFKDEDEYLQWERRNNAEDFLRKTTCNNVHWMKNIPTVTLETIIHLISQMNQ
jgi:hypothetical protein